MQAQTTNTLREKLHTNTRVVVLTGSGISAESGIATFRDAQTGLWARYQPEQLATPEAFQANPKLVWDWYEWRRQNVRAAEPNPAHHALATLQQRIENFTLVTQNVDGLHQRAGSHGVLELHGNITRSRCEKRQQYFTEWPTDTKMPPRCENCDCHSYWRPDVVWFGEGLPMKTLQQAEIKSRQAEVFFSIGTSSLVYPAASLPQIALQNSAYVVEINPDETPLTPYVQLHLRGKAGEILPSLIAEILT